MLDDPRRPTWEKKERDWYFELARDSIGYGVIWAREQRRKNDNAALKVNHGLSNIVSRPELEAASPAPACRDVGPVFNVVSDAVPVVDAG